MFRRPTVLVVGAGCSAEFNLPAGYSFKERISSQLAEIGRPIAYDDFDVVSSKYADRTLLAALKLLSRARARSEYDRLAWSMAEGINYAPSIDNYLHLHKNDDAVVEIGKLAIARQIIEAEHNSWLENDFEISRVRQQSKGLYLWLDKLLEFAQVGADRKDLGAIFNNLTIITFNYDRVIEHFLYHAIQHLGRLSVEETKNALSKLQVIHPYGSVGNLPWQGPSPIKAIGFGAEDVTPQDLIDAGERLRTFTETIEDSEIIGRMHGAIESAETVAFLGFSFLEQNMALLKPDSPCKSWRVYATRYGESDSNVRVYEPRIRSTISRASVSGPVPIVWVNSTAGQFLHDFGRELTG